MGHQLNDAPHGMKVLSGFAVISGLVLNGHQLNDALPSIMPFRILRVVFEGTLNRHGFDRLPTLLWVYDPHWVQKSIPLLHAS